MRPDWDFASFSCAFDSEIVLISRCLIYFVCVCDSRNRETVILKRKKWRGFTLLFNFKRKCIIHQSVLSHSCSFYSFFLSIFFISLRGDQKNVITFFHFLKSICCHDPSRPTFLLSNCHILRGKSYHLFSPLLLLFVYLFFICSTSHLHRNWIGKAPRRSEARTRLNVIGPSVVSV